MKFGLKGGRQGTVKSPTGFHSSDNKYCCVIKHGKLRFGFLLKVGVRVPTAQVSIRGKSWLTDQCSSG